MDSHLASIKKHNSREQFQKYFLNPDEFSNLCDSCVTGDTEGIACRWTAWRACLGLLPIGDEAKMRAEVKKQRSYYATEFDKYMNFRGKSKLTADEDNPLSTAASNPWNSFYTDSYIKEEIQKDIERTYRAVDFFLSKTIEVLMSNVLFIWAKQNSDLSYRQGMNEIVALLTHVCFTENYKPTNPEQDIYDFINDEAYAEADIYTAFKRIMECEQKNMFVYQQPASNKPGKKKKPEPGDPAARPDLPFSHRAVYIQEELLPQLHPYLFSHFKSLYVEPNIYMMRWLRCMLATEFKFDQALQLWDAIFGYQAKYAPDAKKFKMLDYLCVMMILNISDELLGIDNGGIILGRLLKYPPTDDVNAFITICNSHILSHLHAGGVKKETATTGLENSDSNSLPDSVPEEESKPSLSTSPDKKPVFFNPQMSIFKPKKGISAQKTDEQAYDPNDPLSGPMIKKRPAETKPVNPASQISPPKEYSAPQGQVKSKPISGPPGMENDILSQKQTVKPAEPKENPVLFGTSNANTSKPSNPFARELSKETPVLLGGNKPKTTFPFGAEPRAAETLPTAVSSAQKDSAECIKKLQNAIKLINLENEKNGSLVLEEALTDLNSVMKIIKEKLSKS